MKKIYKSLKPFIGAILISIALLFVQAFADLKLPNSMSHIVNVGLQQSGVEHASPDQISEEGLRFVVSLLPEQQAGVILESYSKKGTSFVLNEDSDREKLDILFGESVWTMMNLSKSNPNAPTVGDQGFESDFDIKQMYALTPMFEMMDQNIKAEAYQKATAMEDSLKLQTGVVFAKLYYQELGVDIDQVQRNYILKSGASMLGVTLIGMGAMVAVAYISSKIGSGFARNLRRDVFDKIEGFSSEEFDKFSASSMVVRTVNDVNQVQQMITLGIRMFFYAPIMAIGGVIMIMNRDTSMSWIIVVACAGLLAMLAVIYVVAVPKFKIMQKFVDRLNLVFRENLTGLMVIRAFGNKGFEANRFEKANKDRADLALFINRVMSLMMPLMTFMMNITMLAIIWFGSQQISNGVLQIGDMMAFMQYSMQIIMSFLMIAMMFIFIPRAIVSLNRIREVLDTESSIEEPSVPVNLIQTAGATIEFDHVSFRYDGADESVLKDISFMAKPGQTTAIIGSTGSGKSTLINLIPRFYDVTEGVIRYNGVNIKDVTTHDLRDQIGFVPQKGMLLTGDIRSNLSFGNPSLSDDRLLKALEISQAQFVLNSDESLDYKITQGGTNVSGGQRQRLTIARALAKDSSVLIFDDSFSALDFKTDQLLRKAIKENVGDKTIFIVAQRVNTIMDADQILVLDEGELVGIGTHQNLLNTCPTYYEIASSQLSEEELQHGTK